MKLNQFQLHIEPKPLIERSERLIQEQDLGLTISARAKATRCRSPPESWPMRRSCLPSKRTVLQTGQCGLSSSGAGTPPSFKPYSTFSQTDM